MLIASLGLVPLICASSASPIPATFEDTSFRAKVWATISLIQDQSILRYEAEETAYSTDEDRGRSLRTFTTVRSDEFRNVRVVGTQTLMDHQAQREVFNRRLEHALVAGVLRTANAESEYGLVRPENPGEVWPWTYPSVYMARGHGINPLDMRLRAEHLLGCSDLRIQSEDGERVVLKGTGRVDARLFVHVVTLNASTGDVLEHLVIDPVWSTHFVNWKIDGWEEHDGVRVPGHVEYRVYEHVVSRDALAELSRRVKERDLEAGCQSPDSPHYAGWCQIRDDYFGETGVPIRPAGPMQVCTIRYTSVNAAVPPDWFDLPSRDKITNIMSGALELVVDRFELEPTPEPEPEGRDK